MCCAVYQGLFQVVLFLCYLCVLSLGCYTVHQKKPRLRDRTDRAWFSRLVRHPARKRSWYILTTPEPARDNNNNGNQNGTQQNACPTKDHRSSLIQSTPSTQVQRACSNRVEQFVSPFWFVAVLTVSRPRCARPIIGRRIYDVLKTFNFKFSLADHIPIRRQVNML